MCGISGFVAKQGNLLPNSVIVKMNELINHRGPDGEGFIFLTPDQRIITAGGKTTSSEVWKSQTDYRPNRNIIDSLEQLSLMAFGHKRLSILDLSPTGHQPMCYGNGRYWIVFNGEIYNYKEINLELEKLGHRFTTKSDTETVLAAYSEWKEACLDRFAGMWAFAIYDQIANEIFMARDRYGIKPLYYYFSPEGDFYFASEIKQFIAVNGWQSKMNPERVYDQLIYSLTDHTDETMFAGVFQLPGGTFLRSSLSSIIPGAKGRIKFEKWYFVRSDPFKGSFDEAVSIFKTLFERSVKEHLNSDVPLGTALSGGIDSSSIACQISRTLINDGSGLLPKTFSSCSTNDHYTEKKWIDIVLKHIKVDSHIIYPRLEDVFVMTPDIIWHHDEPYQSQSAFLGYNLNRLANSKGVKVLLNGQGADEYLGGYGQFTISRYAKMIIQLKFKELLSDIKNLQKIREVSNSELFRDIILHYLPLFIKRGITKIKSDSDNVKSIIDVNRLNIKPVHPFDFIPVGYKSVAEISQHLTFFSSLPKYLHWEDRNSMAHSVEARIPFLDHRLVEFSYNLPDDFLKKDGITKRVLREAMDDLVPEEIKNRRDKMGFTTPEEHWVRQVNPALFKDKISQAISVADGIIKPAALKYFDKVVNGRIPFDYTYWRLILLSEWIKKFQVKI